VRRNVIKSFATGREASPTFYAVLDPPGPRIKLSCRPPRMIDSFHVRRSYGHHINHDETPAMDETPATRTTTDKVEARTITDNEIARTAREELASEIASVIAPWSEKEEKPPFSFDQLVAMALASNALPMTKMEIADWLLDRFPFFPSHRPSIPRPRGLARRRCRDRSGRL